MDRHLSIAAASGPLVGGWLVGYSWRWAFWVNVPLCAVVILLAVRYVPESRNPNASKVIDAPGVLFGVAGLAGVTYALTEWPSRGLSADTLIAGVGGVLALVAFILIERRSGHPMLPTSLFTSRSFSVINSVTFAIYAALSGALVFLVLFLQVVSGWTALRAGTATLPLSVVMLLLASRFGTLATRIGARPLMIGRAPHRSNGIRAHVPDTQPPVIPLACASRGWPSGSGPGHDRRAADRQRPRRRPR